MEMNGPRHGYPGAKKTATRTRLSDTQHLFWAAAPKQTVYGASAVHSVNPSINLSAGNPDIIYAPTLDPSALTCIEMTTAYWGGGGKGVYAWDWCAAQPGWRQGIAMDANFLATYTRDSMGFPAYQVRDVQTDAATNRWTSYLFNYNTNSWDTFYSSANTSKLSESGGGWDAFEPYTNTNPNTGEGYYCTETRGSLWFVGGLQYQLTSGGAWSSATSANSTIPAPSTLDPNYGGCNNPSLQFTVNTPNSTYWVSND
ncbi:hypothetical protein ACRB68_54150 [Actinomadura sp. RB68]|uniref:Uncharacterized protein n=2 Tax=Actinomadura macrotermitis TaxID=2585200 RepID=A0A7K0C1G7_9ACTN|nr:hypothetical protein [Actinomadura macrotermitis]